jgi:hypothetical protein
MKCHHGIGASCIILRKCLFCRVVFIDTAKTIKTGGMQLCKQHFLSLDVCRYTSIHVHA